MKQNLGLKHCFSPVPLLSEGQKWSIDLQNASKWWPSLSHPLGVFCFWNCDWVHWHFDFPRRILQIALSFGDSRSMSHTTAVVNALACEEAEFQFSHQWKNEPAFLMHGLMVSICPCILRRMWKALFISMPLSFLQTEAFTSFKAFTTVNLHDNVDWKNTMSLDMIFCQCHPGRQPTWLHQWEIWILSPWTHHWLMWLFGQWIPLTPLKQLLCWQVIVAPKSCFVFTKPQCCFQKVFVPYENVGRTSIVFSMSAT